MDAFLETPQQLNSIFNHFTGVGLTIQAFFVLLTMTKTPKEMSTYKYTLMNCVLWSFLIVIDLGICVRPVTFLPRPICLITGPVKHLGRFWGGSFQVLVGLVFLVNKQTSYTLCLCYQFFSIRFPLFIRRLSLRQGILIFFSAQLSITLVLIGSAYMSGLFEQRESVSTNILKQSIYTYVPEKYRSLQPLIDSSLIIGVKTSIRSVYTIVYLVISSIEILVSLVVMVYAVIYLKISIQNDKCNNSRDYKKRLINMIVIRTVFPMLTFNFPAVFAVYIIQFDRDDISAFLIQMCLLLILLSPTVCCFITILGVKPYRQALFGFARFIKRRFESRIETTSDVTLQTQNQQPRIGVINNHI